MQQLEKHCSGQRRTSTEKQPYVDDGS